jgi:hypothetical protein
MQLLALGTVLVTSQDLKNMIRVWPCSGLHQAADEGFSVSFQFDSNGLCDVSWYTENGIDTSEPEGINGTCLLALSHDAQQFLKGGN